MFKSVFLKLGSRLGTKIAASVQTLNFGICISIVFLFSSLSFTFAYVPNHYIIAFDQCIGKYHDDFLSKTTLNIIERTLVDNGFDKNRDYLSMVAYSLEMGNPSIKKFSRPFCSGENAIVWKILGEKKSLVEMFPNWPVGQPLLNPFFAPYCSMQSLAKPFAVMATSNKKDSLMLAGRTFLLLISDEKVNGVDDNYAQEWNNVATSEEANTPRFRALSNSVFETMRKFNEDFKFIQIRLKKGNYWLNRIPISDDGTYKIIPYEVVFVERPSIHAISDIPSPLPLQRVRGGFRLKIAPRSLSPKYVISNVNISDSEGNILGSSVHGNFNIVLPSAQIVVGDSLSLSMSLILKDGLYNGMIITPENSRYRDGMIIKQAVKIQDEAKVLGILPLSDIFWWWFPNDIFSAVMVWDLIILLMLIIVIGYILYRCFVRINAYEPSNDKLKITKV